MKVIYSIIGQPYELLEERSGRLYVQALTIVGSELYPIGAPCWAYRSDFKPF